MSNWSMAGVLWWVRMLTEAGEGRVMGGPTNVTGGMKRWSFLRAQALEFTDGTVSSAVF